MRRVWGWAQLALMAALASALKIDRRGYIVYCPCMGRFGNQADHFLGALRFAKDLDRTLLLPPWVEYEFANPKAKTVRFSEYFSVEAVREFHRAVELEVFMSELGDSLWPPSQRTAFCWSPRKGLYSDEIGCNAKDGNPFGPFWDAAGVDFAASAYYGETVGGDAQDGAAAKDRWDKVYPPSAYPVLAFTGAPARFPVTERDRELHAYLRWSPAIRGLAEDFVRETLPEGPFLGVHLRNDRDWDNVCQHVGDGARQLFASPQCLGYANQHGRLTKDLCQPSRESIIKEVVAAVKERGLKSVFVAADRDHMLQKLNEGLRQLNVKAYRLRPDADSPHVSLALLGRADFYIGNCVSSFSAFAKRERDAAGKPSGFWSFGPAPLPKPRKAKKPQLDGHEKHSEL